ncbi:MAG: hypothetical protein IJA85_00235 [Clostridia bacterium]|nr:hypothetical protein [Clostridia bacterium]MBQ4573606.1 hypothetical protein [Clostridia bacterium]
MKNKTNGSPCEAWRGYESGVAFNHAIGLYGRIRENARFYRGEQWNGVDAKGLPTPTFNVIKRVIDHAVSTVLSSRIHVALSDEGMAYMKESGRRERRASSVAALERHIGYLWDRCGMDKLFREAALDAAIAGDGVFFTYWDEGAETGQLYEGEIRCMVVDSCDVHVADCTEHDLQKQEYIILCGRAPVCALKREARARGLAEGVVEKICADDDSFIGYERVENPDDDYAKATYLIRFHRNEEGFVVFEKCVKNALLFRVETGMKKYPLASFAWEQVKGCCRGNAPITGLIQNQKYINKAFALMMKHMIDTAFSKVIYDKKLIPEWTNEVGEAIGVISGGDVGNVVKVIGTGEMQENYLEVIDRTVKLTKELFGATDAALGEVNPTNTSAIVALQAASELPFDTLKANIYRCAGELAEIWCEMLLEYYADGRCLCGEVLLPDYEELKCCVLRAKIEVGAGEKFTQMYQLSVLNRLLESGDISAEDYLKRIPEGLVPQRSSLIETMKGGDVNG